MKRRFVFLLIIDRLWAFTDCGFTGLRLGVTRHSVRSYNGHCITSTGWPKSEATVISVHIFKGWLLGWCFNGTFSTKRLYHAIGEQCVKTIVTG